MDWCTVPPCFQKTFPTETQTPSLSVAFRLEKQQGATSECQIIK